MRNSLSLNVLNDSIFVLSVCKGKGGGGPRYFDDGMCG